MANPNINKLLNEERSMQQKIQKSMVDFTAKIVRKIAQEKLEGVEEISTSPMIASVRFSALQREKSWCPETFIPTAQANAVKRKLNSCHSLQTMLSTIEEMVTTKCVKLSGGEKIPLNSKTIEILQESIA